ncbi:MAG: type VI secretion system-associated FHA domain protein TagH [Tabrizicola sp.]|jgi:type VI secretion system protein ImpI|nr:type VI secretion system-associated FHA domain protein TagH [Tabrizicola sp.]
MTLTLRIENFDVLEHGGPVSITLNQSGCDVGRSKAMSWVLPDPGRHISSHHFSVAFRDGGYWLTDVSTNGTFLQGSPYRLQGPHRLAIGDRLVVGHYVIVVEGPAVFHPQRLAEADPWDFGLAPTPVNPMAPPRQTQWLDDVARDFVPAVPMPHPAPTASQPPQAFGYAPMQPPVPSLGAMGGQDFVRAFCEGAGLDPVDYAQVDADRMARELGRAMRNATSEIMLLLRDRAAVKQFTRGGERTMRSATGNNPMKFLPDAEQIIEAMFLRRRDGFMEGAESFGNALADIRRHQAAFFAALQPALAAVLSGLSPDEIEDGAGSGILGGASKGKLWETFLQRWDAKAEAGEHGMLDAFLEAFAKHYAAAVGKAGD